MSVKGKEYRLAIRIAGIIDKSFGTSLAAASASMGKIVSAVDRDFSRLDKGFDSIMGCGVKAFQAISAASAVAALAVGAAVMDCTREATAFEHQMADVMKYVNGLADAAGRASGALALDGDGNILNGRTYKENYQEMKAALLDLSTQIPLTAEELTQLAAAAGQSGKDITELLQYDSDGSISGFLRDTAVMATAMDIAAGQAGDWSAKWEMAFGMSHEEIMVLADQINYLGANSATTAAEIAQVVNDSASLGQIAGIDVSTTAALADAMLATGVGSDRVATSIKRTITNLVKGTSATSAMKEQWEELGFTAEGIAVAMQEDSIGTLKEVFAAIGDLPDYRQVAALSTLFGQWAIEGDAKIVGNLQVFEDALEMVGDPARYGGSMEREFTIKAGTSESIDTMVENAFRAMKINIGDSFLPIKKEYGQKLIAFIGEISEKIASFNEYLSGANGLSRWMQDAETQFPTLQRKFRKYAQPVFSGIMETGKWITKNGKGIISVLAGIGTALASYKAASETAHAIKAIMSLGNLQPVTLGILGAAAAAGLLAGAFAAYKQHEQALVDQSLADHFGSIALSMEDLQRVAEYIIGSDSLGGVKEALEAFRDLDGISATMQDAVAEIDKLNWKISIGMELTEDESESYKQAIDTYVQSAQEYALQSRYAVSLNLQFAFPEDDLEGQDVVAKVNQFYQDQYDELSALGADLNAAVTNAFNDGFLDIEEAEAIANIQRQMAEIKKSLATGEFDAQLSVLEMKYAGGGGLTAESFQNLQGELTSQLAEASAAYQESYVKNYAAIQAAYEAGDYLDESEYQRALESLQWEYLENVSAAQARAMNFQLETIMGQYAGELDPAIESYMQQAQETIASYAENGESAWMENASSQWLGMIEELRDTDLDSTSRKAIKKLLKTMQPTIDEMQALRQQYEAMGREVPESLLRGLSDFALLDVLSGADLDPDSIGNVLGEQLVRSGYYDSFYEGLIEQLQGVDYYVPEEVMDGIGNAAAEGIAWDISAAAEANIRPAVEGMYAWSQETINEYCAQGFQAEADVAITLNPAMHYNPRLSLPELPGLGGLEIDENADGGIIRSRELSWLAEEGPEAVIPLDGSRNAVSLWEKAGRLLGMGSTFDGLDLGGGDTVTVRYSPVLNFYGEAPDRDDLADALDISQDKFDRLMDRYLKTRSRVSFG